MPISIPSARYWRIVITKPYGTGPYNPVRFATLRLTDSAGTPLTHSSVSAPLFAVSDGVIASLADTDTGTSCGWGHNWSSINFGTLVVQYDMGSAVTPAKVLARMSNSTVYHAFVGSNYTPYSPEQTQAYVMASTDGTNFFQVGLVPTLVTAFGVDTITAIDTDATSLKYRPDITIPLSGDGGIYGIVSEDGVPVSRPVMLYERDLFNLVRRTASNENGGYSFTGLNTDRDFLVMAVDTTEETGQPGVYKNALVKDRIRPILANSFPTDGRPWFFRLRTVMKPRPVSVYGFAGPGATPTGQFAPMLYIEGTPTNIIDEAAGGGYDLRSLPIPVPSGLRAIYTNTLSVFRLHGSMCAVTAGFSIELIAEIPSGADANSNINFNGVGLGLGHRCATGVIFELLPTGVVNVRFATNASQTLSPVRVTGTTTPGTLAHIVLCYAENQQARLYINGALAGTGSLSGLGALFHGQFGASATWVGGGATEGSVGGSHRIATGLQGLQWWAGAGMLAYNATTSATRTQTGLVWGAIYDYDLSSDPTAGGVPISIQDLYSTWASNSVWLAGSRPGGWPATPAFSGYAVEVAADAPQVWHRLQATNGNDPVRGFGMHDNIGYFTGSGNTFLQPGFTNGSNSIGFGATGGLRIFGVVGSTAAGPYLYRYASGYPLGRFGTFETWYRPSSLSQAQQTLFFTINQPNNLGQLWVYVSSAGKVNVRFTDSTGTYVTVTFAAATTLVTGTGYHLAVTWDSVVATKVRLYINGALAEEQNFFTNNHLTQGETGYIIGNVLGPPNAVAPYNSNVSATTSSAQGDIQDLALYNYPLSAARIAAHYAARNN